MIREELSPDIPSRIIAGRTESGKRVDKAR